MILVVEKQSNQITVQKQVVLRVRILEFNLPSGITNQVFTQKGEIIVGSGDGTYIVFPPGADGEYLKFDSTQPGGVTTGVPTLDVEDTTNYLVNPGWDFAQEQTPGTLTTIADGGYSADQWKCYRENADLQYRRVDGSGVSGLTSNYYGEYKKITNAGKFLVMQPLEYLNTVRFRGKTISFQLQMMSNAARTMKIAILELQSAGVADTIPAVVSAWNADATDPTLGANIAVIGTPVSCAVTTAMQTFQFSGTFPTTSKNLMVAVWSDADLAVNDTVGMAEAGLRYGASLRSWTPINRDEEIRKIIRFVWKTFPLDTAPAQNAGQLGVYRFIAGRAGANPNYTSFRIPTMRAAPGITLYNPGAANAQVRDTSVGLDCSSSANVATITSESCISFSCTGNASTFVGGALDVHILAKPIKDVVVKNDAIVLLPANHQRAHSVVIRTPSNLIGSFRSLLHPIQEGKIKLIRRSH